jgi:hypothetical protein
LNCREAREMLSAYRDLKNEQSPTADLEIHLAACPDCRQALDQYNLLARRIHALPRIEIAPEAYSRLMKTLANEHALYLKNSTASTTAKPVPDFLVSYLHDQNSAQKHALTAFSTAETGPLPVISQSRKRRYHSRSLPQFGIIGLVAVVLMLLMTGGLTSMLILTGGKPVNLQPASINIQQSQITPNLYNTNTIYNHVVSGIADNDSVYFTAYNDQAQWMLQKLDTKGQTQESTPLLPATSPSPLIVLGSANNWLIWLQLDIPKLITSKTPHDHASSSRLVRTWSLYSLYLDNENSYSPHMLMSDTFDESTAPDWTHTPIQGISFLKNTLLLTLIDAKGVSHLDQYNLDTGSNQTLATTTSDGHVFASPTANSDGSDIYWTEEWQSDDNVMHGNIWTQQIRAAIPSYGRWQPHNEANIFLFRDDENSFHPQVINNTLFLLSTNANNSSTTSVHDAQTPTAISSPQITPTPAIVPLPVNITPEVDPKIYGPQADATLQGHVLAFKLGNYTPVPLPPVLSDKIATVQAGSRFLLYQNSSGAVGLYDTLVDQALTIVSTVKNATFLAVNGETAVWISNNTPDTTNTTSSESVQINMFTLTIKLISKPLSKP